MIASRPRSPGPPVAYQIGVLVRRRTTLVVRSAKPAPGSLSPASASSTVGYRGHGRSASCGSHRTETVGIELDRRSGGRPVTRASAQRASLAVASSRRGVRRGPGRQVAGAVAIDRNRGRRAHRSIGTPPLDADGPSTHPTPFTLRSVCTRPGAGHTLEGFSSRRHLLLPIGASRSSRTSPKRRAAGARFGPVPRARSTASSTLLS